ncbi:hypothetical protein NIES4073_15410 [Kalymmatonema gypsitolerans NIES-4073]|nr:hypothetical protein NIES4073_15410 [Scytonema sp. NIES-4073]
MCNAQQLVKEEVEVKKRQFSNLAASSLKISLKSGKLVEG